MVAATHRVSLIAEIRLFFDGAPEAIGRAEQGVHPLPGENGEATLLPSESVCTAAPASTS